MGAEGKVSTFQSEPIASSTHSPVFDGLYELSDNPIKSVTADDIARSRRNIPELTKIGECEDP